MLESPFFLLTKRLTIREQKTLSLLVSGYSLKESAELVSLSHK